MPRLTVVAADLWVLWPEKSGARIPDYAYSSFRFSHRIATGGHRGRRAAAADLAAGATGNLNDVVPRMASWHRDSAGHHSSGLADVSRRAARFSVVGPGGGDDHRDRQSSAFYHRPDLQLHPGLFLDAMLFLALQGALAFRADQNHGPRFLAQCGVSPRAVWFCRPLVWGSWVWLCSIFIFFLVPIRLSRARCTDWTRDPSDYPWAPWASFAAQVSAFLLTPFYRYLLPLATAYAAGQLMSLFVRRTLLAVTFSMLL